MVTGHAIHAHVPPLARSGRADRCTGSLGIGRTPPKILEHSVVRVPRRINWAATGSAPAMLPCIFILVFRCTGDPAPDVIGPTKKAPMWHHVALTLRFPG
jgi:hypothetical protein